MNRFAYRAYYQYDGPTKANPYRTEKTADGVVDAIQRFPMELEYLLPEGARIEIQQHEDPKSSRIVVVTPADRVTTNATVERCLMGLDLYGERL
ncbi:hypothetical protein [Cupriavidus sp. UME77]|uniref:hypothetical protein n=1 Tax=Cupriavidus sp. UME77 TaxID=1862321 RepID=UPI0015FFB6B9|nr:hypothetical protein [Cupriavidus sp. UME77]MBB1636088.1 hypothetical protein [Cupriavidus sp. UME77]